MNEIFTRRSIRKYLEKPIENGKIEQLLRAAMQAPSAGNQQPWEFIVVGHRDRLIQLSRFSPYASMTAEAAAAVILLTSHKRLKFSENWQQDMGAATQNLLLEAVSLGLGAVWLGVAPDAKRENHIRTMFDLDNDYQPFAVVPIGYPAQDNTFVDRYDPSRVRYD